MKVPSLLAQIIQVKMPLVLHSKIPISIPFASTWSIRLPLMSFFRLFSWVCLWEEFVSYSLFSILLFLQKYSQLGIECKTNAATFVDAKVCQLSFVRQCLQKLAKKKHFGLNRKIVCIGQSVCEESYDRKWSWEQCSALISGIHKASTLEKRGYLLWQQCRSTDQLSGHFSLHLTHCPSSVQPEGPEGQSERPSVCHCFTGRYLIN